VRTVRYLEEARAEFLHEVAYLSAVDPLLGQRFDEAVQRAETLAAEFADMGMPYKHGTRRVFPGRFKFSIVYLTHSTEIVVVAVAPFQRKPGYWASRLASKPGDV
jgi:toxin ParE1/3/4